MAAYYKVEVSLNTNSVTVGSPSAQEVLVTLPLVGPQGPAGAAGTGLETLTTRGDTLYRGTTTGERLAIGTEGQILKVSAGGIPEWGAAPASGVSSVNGETGAVTVTVPSASSTTPAALGTAAVGSASTFARADHVHAMPTAANVGAAATVHTHTANQILEARQAFNITSTNLADPTLVDAQAAFQDIDGGIDCVVVLNNTTGIVYATVNIPAVGDASRSGRVVLRATTSGLGDITYFRIEMEGDIIYPASGYAEINPASPQIVLVWKDSYWKFEDEQPDSAFRIVGGTDATKKVAFEVDTLVSTATTRTLTVPNASGTIALTGQLTDTQIFTANGTWTKPAGARLVHYFIVAGGGGGGSGRRDTTANNAGGGGGGAGGSVNVGWVDASALANTVTVTIGAGGGGGAGNRPNNSSGNAGAAGGASSFGSLSSTGGQAGSAGSGSTGGGGASESAGLGLYYGTSRGRGPSGTGGFTANATAPAASIGTAAGGGGGGGKQATTYFNGANGGAIGNVTSTAGGTFVANAAGNAGSTWAGGYFGTGGGGGSPGTGGQANNGGDGGLYGGGGGGGSACNNDAGGDGKGGDGAPGIVIVTTYF